MSILVPINGVNYIIPTPGETGWGSNLDSFFVAISSGTLQKNGGSFLLSNEVDFGAAFGLKALYYKAETGTVATAGTIRLASADPGIAFRNNIGSGNLVLTTNASDQLIFNGVPIESNALTNTHILVGNVSNVATDVAMSGDIAITNTGATTIQAGAVTSSKIAAGTIVDSNISASAAIAYSKLALTNSIVNADINSAAAIALSKLAALSINLAVSSDGVGHLTTGTTTFTELEYVHGVTSSIQTQLNNKAATATTITAGTGLTGGGDLSANRTISLTAPVTVALGGTGDTSLTAYAVLCGGTTTTGAIQPLASLGASGQVLTSGGPGVLPAFHDALGSGTVNSGTAGRLALYPTSTTTVGDTYVQNTHNITLAVAAQGSRSADLALTIPNPGNAITAANVVLDQGAYTIAGALTLSSALTLANGSVGTPTLNLGDVTTGLYRAASNRIGLVINGAGTLTLASDTLFPVTTAAVDLGGASNKYKNFYITNIVGTTTNDNAATGAVGETVTSGAVATGVSSSMTYMDVTSISLTAGDWLVSCFGDLNPGLANPTGYRLGIGTVSGNNAPTSPGDNEARSDAAVVYSLSVPSYRMSLASGTTTVYLKGYAVFISNNPSIVGRISAVRIR